MNKITKIIVGVVVVVLVVWGIVAGKEDSESNVVKIGYFGPFTGLLAASTGESVAEGFKLAEAKRHTFGNKKVEVVYEDDSCDPKKAVSAAQKLLVTDGVKILVNGVCSSSMLAVAPMAEKNKVILITPTAASPKITDAGDYIFRLSSPTIGMTQKVVDFLGKSSYTSVALLFENNEYPAAWKDTFVSQFKGKIIVEGVAPGATDVKSQLLKLSTGKPQVYVFTAITPAVASAMLKQFKELSLKGVVVGNDTFSTRPVSERPEAEGIYTVTYGYDLGSPTLSMMLKDYSSKYKRDAKEAIYAALGYDTYNALFDAIAACDGADASCVKSKLYALNNVNGASGVYGMDNNGDTHREFAIRKVANGALVEIK